MLKTLDELFDTVIQLPALFLFSLQIVYAMFVLLALGAIVFVIAVFVAQEHWSTIGEWLKNKVKVSLRIPCGNRSS